MTPVVSGLHLVGIILWMGGLFQLARHLAQHAKLDAEATDTRIAFADWERITYYYVSLPGLILALSAGLYALFDQGWLYYLNAGGRWGSTFHMKLMLIVILIGADQFLHYKMKRLHAGDDVGSSPFMAVHGIVALIFIVLIFMMTTEFLA